MARPQPKIQRRCSAEERAHLVPRCHRRSICRPVPAPTRPTDLRRYRCLGRSMSIHQSAPRLRRRLPRTRHRTRSRKPTPATEPAAPSSRARLRHRSDKSHLARASPPQQKHRPANSPRQPTTPRMRKRQKRGATPLVHARGHQAADHRPSRRPQADCRNHPQRVRRIRRQPAVAGLHHRLCRGRSLPQCPPAIAQANPNRGVTPLPTSDFLLSTDLMQPRNNSGRLYESN